jgi:hypothetical protein
VNGAKVMPRLFTSPVAADSSALEEAEGNMSGCTHETDRLYPDDCGFFQPVEQYLAELENGRDSGAPRSSLGVVDALLTALMISLRRGRWNAIDLAADATAGVSTLLFLVHPFVDHVILPRAGRERRWQFALSRYLDGRTPIAALSETDRDSIVADARLRKREPCFVFTSLGGSDGLDVAWRWLSVQPQTMIFGLGSPDSTEWMRSLATRFGPATPFRAVLLRELAPTLSQSRLAILAARDLPLDGLVEDLRERFVLRYHYLDLVKTVCADAWQKAAGEQFDSALLAEMDGRTRLRPAKETLRTLERAVELRQDEVEELRHRINEFKKSVTYKVMQRVDRGLGLVAPRGSRRREWLDKLIATVRRFLRGHNRRR